jgi:PAS domain S-box-containing protein
MTTTMRAPATGRRGTAGLVGALLIAELIVFGISTVPGVRTHPGFDPLLDGWLQGGAYVTAAVLAALRPVLRPTARRIWMIVALALGLRALGFVLYLSYVRTLQPLPYPSIADVCWLLMPVVLVAGFAGFARRRFEHVATSIVLDGLVGALACAALAVTLLAGTLQGLTRSGTPTSALLTNVLYPFTDLVLLIVIVGMSAAFAWRPPRVLQVASVGIAAFAIVDTWFLYESTAGTYRPGTPIAALSLVATALIASTAWVPPQPQRVRDGTLPDLVAPGVFALVCLGTLVAGAIDHVPFAAVVLATVGLMVALARTALSFGEVNRLTARLRGQALRIRRSEEAARAEAERLGAVLGGVDDYAIVGGRAGRCAFFSPGAERMLGYRADEVVGHHGPELFHLHSELAARAAELGVAPVGDALVAVARRAGKETRRWTYVRKDGSHLPVAVTVSAVRDSDEEFVCVARDVTDELRIESYRDTRERLAAELARMTRPDAPVLRTVLRIVIEGMGWDLGHVWLAEGDALRCVATWHGTSFPGAEELERSLGRTRLRRGEGLAGRVWDTGSVVWISDLAEEELQLTAAQREGLGPEVRAAVSLPIVAADGEAPLGVLQLFARRPRAPETELLTLLESVAATFGRQLERVRTAQELRFARDEAEAADRAKTELVSRISHELRTPLNAILGFAQLLDRDELTERQHAQTEQIASGGRHLVAVIDDLIDLSRIETGELRVSLESVSVTAMLREVIELIRPLVDERGLELEVDAHGGIHEHVCADYQRLRQVLLNLLSNAVKYNRPGGRISLFFEDPGDGRLGFAVRDTGAGIAQRDLPLLFQAFERLGAERGAEQGTGLGLVVSRGLVEAMGGRLLVASEVGVGTTFRVELDRAAAAAPVHPGDRHGPETLWWPAGEGSEATVLYVEDNPANLHLVRDIVAARPGLELLTATRGSAGLELARRRRPDLVLLDMNLPDVSGEDVLTALKADAATSAIPVLVLSADATPERRGLVLERGAAGYLAKPLDIGEFVVAVRALLPDADRSAS